MSEHPPEKFPQYGWGQLLAEQLRSMASFNVAQSGRSSKSFREEGHFQRALSHLNKGDWVLIQFGHNDQKEDHRGTTPEQYKENLRKYIREIREAEAIPLLLSPVQRRYFSEQGRMLNPHEGYHEMVEEVAKEESTFFIDLTKLSSDAYVEQGPEASKAWFMWLKQGEEPNYPEGVNDNTHFSEQGARAIAQIVVNEWKKLLKNQ
ncbi:hypothetical protein AB990_21055 [Alkalihalobacillus pseudalcaliphilus]|nr:hypothetical protein AB990_21055 [Alkalihalobacillus pseudalcaliphilus]